MKTIRIKYIKLLLILLMLCAFSLNCFGSSQWDLFLQQPDEERIIALEESIQANIQDCDAEMLPSETQAYQLFELVGNGDKIAFKAALMVSRCWDGGLLEDYNRAAGSFFELAPLEFLKIVKDKEVPESELKYMFTMLPLSTVDNINLKISLAEKRIEILENINDKSYEEIKNIGINILKNMKENLERIKKELRSNQ